MATNKPVPSTDPADLLFNAQKTDEFVNGSAPTFIDRKGVTRKTIAGLEAEFPDAGANAALSVVQAQTAVSAANIALAAQTAAEAARDSLNTTGKVFTAAEGAAAGIAATTNGQQFSVLAVDLLSWTVYRNNAGAALPLAQSYTKAYFDALLNTTDYGASGVAWGVADGSNNLALAVKSDGSVSVGDQDDVASAIPGGKLATTHFEKRADGSGYAFAVADPNDNLALAVLADGTVWVYGKEAATQPSVDTLNDLALGTKTIVAWGDSLTEGTGSTGGSTYPAQLAALLGGSPTVINEGFGGQTADKIMARQGGNAAMVTVTGNSIPASGPVAVTLDINVLSYPTAATLSLTGYLAGVLGTLTKSTTDTYTFTRAVAGSAVLVPPGTPFLVSRSTRNISGLELDKGLNLFWVGSNDTGTPTMAGVLAHIEKGIAKLTPNRKRFIILSPITNVVYTNATQQYADMRAVIDAIKAKWPRNFIDIQKLLVYSYNPSIPQDVTDFNNGVTPTSLRAAGDGIHLNNTGYGIVAAAVKAFIDMKGWMA